MHDVTVALCLGDGLARGLDALRLPAMGHRVVHQEAARAAHVQQPAGVLLEQSAPVGELVSVLEVPVGLLRAVLVEPARVVLLVVGALVHQRQLALVGDRVEVGPPAQLAVAHGVLAATGDDRSAVFAHASSRSVAATRSAPRPSTRSLPRSDNAVRLVSSCSRSRTTSLSSSGRGPRVMSTITAVPC